MEKHLWKMDGQERQDRGVEQDPLSRLALSSQLGWSGGGGWCRGPCIGAVHVAVPPSAIVYSNTRRQRHSELIKHVSGLAGIESVGTGLQ